MTIAKKETLTPMQLAIIELIRACKAEGYELKSYTIVQAQEKNDTFHLY